MLAVGCSLFSDGANKQFILRSILFYFIRTCKPTFKHMLEHLTWASREILVF